MLLLLICSCGVQPEEKTIVKNVVQENYKEFTKMAQDVILKSNVYPKNSEGEWLWKIEKDDQNHAYIVKYGYFRKLSKAKIFVGNLVADITEAITFGVFKYNPYGENKGVFIKLRVNTKTRVATIIK